MVFVEPEPKTETVDNSNSSIHPDTGLGYVHLTVSDLARSITFYEHSLGFQTQEQSSTTAYLGAGNDPLLLLSEIPGARLIPGRTGMYHFAILTPSRRALSKSLRNFMDTETPIQGGADHLVSEAIYLADPDGNGIEIYCDRPREQWEYENGQLKMATEQLDYRGILAEMNGESASWTGLEPGTKLGHIHLHVADLAEATAFYQQVIGFDFILTYMNSASFLSAGGYHHHIGINIWNGIGSSPPPDGSVGLRYFSINLPGENDLVELVARLEAAKVAYENREGNIFTRDPSQNGMLFTSK